MTVVADPGESCSLLVQHPSVISVGVARPHVAPGNDIGAGIVVDRGIASGIPTIKQNYHFNFVFMMFLLLNYLRHDGGLSGRIDPVAPSVGEDGGGAVESKLIVFRSQNVR